jgi:hypothetical protein
MKIMSFLFIVIFLTYACSSIIQQEIQAKVVKEQVEYTIYLDSFEPSGFTNADFTILQEITKDFPERLDVIANDIAYRLTSQDTIHSEFYCKWIDSVQGVFRMITDKYCIDFLVSFSEKGEPLDYKVFKGANRELVNEKRIYTKFYSDYYFSDEFIVINTLDTTEKVLHPHAAKVLKTDNWHIDENGKFKLIEE